MKIFLQTVTKIIALLLVLAVLNTNCKCSKECRVILPSHKDSQLVVYRKPGVSDADWNAKKNKFITEHGTFTVKKLCEGCDNSLELWEGGSIQNYISTEVASSGKSGKVKPSGEDEVSYYSLNFNITIPFEKDVPPTDSVYTYTSINNAPNNKEPVLVAVFDTGDDPAITNNFSTTVPSCKAGGGQHGWNFVGPDNNNLKDDNHIKHGTVVSSFIVEQVNKGSVSGGSPVKILPVKIFGASGSSDLFTVLCAFAYAKNAGAKIINASFGFYYYGDASGPQVPVILLEYVRNMLTGNNIILVAAAGNKDPQEDSSLRDIRNLNINHFYPGGLAAYLPNVFCVTTKKNGQHDISSLQNYSGLMVDVAAESDIAGTDQFRNPFVNTDAHLVAGSSFATPIFTGKLCSHYADVVTMPLSKMDIIKKLQPSVILTDPLLVPKIVQGNFIKR